MGRAEHVAVLRAVRRRRRCIVSFIGTLGQYSLSDILQKVEAKAKTGLLIIKKDGQWVEFSFRRGLMMCIGPIRSNRTLGERLLQVGIISQQAFQEVTSILGSAQQSETRTAICLIELGYLNQDNLRAWATQETSRVLEALFAWSTGEIFFEEELLPPVDRLLIALSVSSLLPQQKTVSTTQAGVFSTRVPEQSIPGAPSPVILDAQTLQDASQFFDASAISSISAALSLSEVPVADEVNIMDAFSPSSVPFSAPRRVTEPLRPRRFDTSLMQPQMVLIPTNLSELREQNPRIQLSPEQWRLFTRADGSTSLQMACQLLVMPRELVCQVAGELFELGLVTITMPASESMRDQSPVPQDIVNAALSNNHALQATGNNPFSPAPIETHSQWGNGGNGATFVLGGGWVVSSSTSQPLLPNDPYSVTGNIYAQAGGAR